MQPTQWCAVFEDLDFGLLEDFLNVFFSNFIKSNAFLWYNPGENLALEVEVGPVDVDAFSKSLKNRAVMSRLVLSAFAHCEHNLGNIEKEIPLAGIQ